MNAAVPPPFRYIGHERRVREDRRFVAGAGRYAADVVLADTLHVVPLQSDHAAARILSIDATEALALPGVHAVVTGAELAAATEPLMNGAHAPLVIRYPLAVDQVRYAGEWVAAIVAESRALAEDARELVRVEYAKRCRFWSMPRRRCGRIRSPVHPKHGSNILLDRHFMWGAGGGADSPRPRTRCPTG